MTEKDLEFLENLKNEMLIQDTHYTANPRFWVVAEKVKEYSPTGEGDSVEYVCTDLDMYSYNLLTFVEYILDNYSEKDLIEELQYSYPIFQIISEFGDVNSDDEELLFEVYNSLGYRVEKYYFDWVYKISENHNTFFLTEKECEEHIEKNYYHYNRGIPYCVYGFRCYGLEQLIDLITKTDWTKLKEFYENNRN